jgi:YVTN family beta-propeller protein
MSNIARRFILGNTAALVAALLLAIGTKCAAAQRPYKVLSEWKIGGSGTWDYLEFDPAAHVLYVTHRTSVAVLDSNTGKLLATIGDLKNAHGVALNTDGKLGYVSDGLSNNVLVFDRISYKPVTTVPTGGNPDGIVFEPTTKSVWVFNGKSNDVSVIDAASNKVVATIPLPGKPEFPVADGKGSVYDNLEDKGSIVRLDAQAKKISATWKLTGCDAPTGMAIDATKRRLFSVCDNNKMAIMNADSGTVLGLAAIGDSPDAARFSAKYQLAYSSNGGGTLTVVDAANKYEVIQNLAISKGAATLAYDEQTDRIFLSVAEYGPAPASTAKVRHPAAPMLPDSFKVVVVGR